MDEEVPPGEARDIEARRGSGFQVSGFRRFHFRQLFPAAFLLCGHPLPVLLITGTIPLQGFQLVPQVIRFQGQAQGFLRPLLSLFPGFRQRLLHLNGLRFHVFPRFICLFRTVRRHGQLFPDLQHGFHELFPGGFGFVQAHAVGLGVALRVLHARGLPGDGDLLLVQGFEGFGHGGPE